MSAGTGSSTGGSGLLVRVARGAVVVLALPVVLVAAWWFASAGSTSFFWPPLSTIAAQLLPTWLPRLGSDVLPSVLRLLGGYLVALVLGVSAGVAIGSNRVLRAVLEPVLEFLRAIPPPVLIPVIALFVGYTGDTAKVVTIALGCVWPVLLNTVEGVRSVDEVLRDTARTYRLRRRTRLVQLTLRGASPQIAAGARQALSLGVILMVISELFGASASGGMGAAIVQFQRSFALPQMWTGIIVLGLLGVALSLVFQLVERRALAWYRGLRQADRTGA